MEKIKVIHICDKFGVGGSSIHGVSRSLSWWLPRFDPSRFDVKLYGVKRPDAASRELEALGVDIEYLMKSRIDPSTLATFLSLIKREKPHILHLHGWIAANFGRVAGRIAGVRTIMHEQGVSNGYPRSQQAVDFLMSRFTDVALVVSNAGKHFLTGKRFVKPSKVRVIYCGIPLEGFVRATPEVVTEEKHRLGIPLDSPVIGTIGRVDVQKGMDYMVRAAPAVLERVPNAYFLIIGDGPAKESLEAEAHRLGVHKSVVFAGYRSDVPVMQSIMDIQLIVSLWEASSLTIFEAMAMGMAIIATRVDGLGEIIERDGQPAILIPPGDSESMAREIIRLITDTELAAQFRMRARSVAGKHDVDLTVEELESLYEELYMGSSNCCRK